MNQGEIISVSPCTKTWHEMSQEELEGPTYIHSGCDILTRLTLEDIVNNNESLE